MKTICPHCKQEFPETPDEYLGMTLECPVCQKEFVCEKAKFCSECGAASAAGALKCARCGKFFPAAPQKPAAPPVRDLPRDDRDSIYVPDDDCFLEEVDLLTPWRKIAEFQGRSRRKECIFSALTAIVLDLLFMFILPDWLSVVTTLSLLVSIPLGVRRLHDIGLSGWWLVPLLLLPPVYVGVLLGWPSQPGENRWGINPAGVPGTAAPRSTAKCLAVVLAIGFSPYLILVAALLPALQQARERARQITCSSNLKQIGTAIQLYASSYNERFPPDLRGLERQEVVTDAGVFLCPSSGRRYIYLGNGLAAENDLTDIPVVMENPANHGKYINILYGGGYVQGHMLSRKMTSCEEVLKELHPKLSQSSAGRTVLENAQRADEFLR